MDKISKKPGPEVIKKAIDDVKSKKLTLRAAAEKYGIPRSTLHDKVRGKISEWSINRGPDPYLTLEEETKICEWCINLSKCGFPIKSDDLLNTVQKIVKDSERQTPFLNGRPGKTWLKNFFKRNPSLAKREAETITKGRAIITEEFIRKWFKDLSTYLKNIGQSNLLNDPSRIINGDESSFNLCPKMEKL